MCTISDGEEGRYVAQSIYDYKMNQQMKNSEFAVLYRTNSQSRAIEDALRKKYRLQNLWWNFLLSKKGD